MLLGRFSGVSRFVTRLVDELAGQDGIRIVALMGNEPYAPWIERADIDILYTDFSRADRVPVKRWRLIMRSPRMGAIIITMTFCIRCFAGEYSGL